ncbi:hypothetical protein BLNAU_6244 [Blattamonas nauphoetae]|uniref:Uncharacterized protein n=1 Tax=Blattamonas nauphoetae TaxID=2049346 RepID=A0ABQ9Y4S6_9EUKA|nr:hypothetical protein BLNAU_6244 [Blattamonas nauphoetae]
MKNPKSQAKMNTQSPSTSAMISVLIAMSIFLMFQLIGSWFSSSPYKAVLGGLLCSFFFVAVLTLIGNIKEIMNPTSLIGWTPCVISLLLTGMLGGSVDGLSALTGFDPL